MKATVLRVGSIKAPTIAPLNLPPKKKWPKVFRKKKKKKTPFFLQQYRHSLKFLSGKEVHTESRRNGASVNSFPVTANWFNTRSFYIWDLDCKMEISPIS